MLLDLVCGMLAAMGFGHIFMVKRYYHMQEQDEKDSDGEVETGQEIKERDPFWNNKDELIGLLASVNQRLEDAGNLFQGLAILVYVVGSVVLYLDLAADYGYTLAKYNRWLVYVAVFVFFIIINETVSMIQRSFVYMRYSGQIRQEITKAGMTRNTLISKSEEHLYMDLKTVMKKIKRDNF